MLVVVAKQTANTKQKERGKYRYILTNVFGRRKYIVHDACALETGDPRILTLNGTV